METITFLTSKREYGPVKVLEKIKKLFSCSYPEKEFKKVENAYNDVTKLFEGKFKGYQACNLEYHSFSHTMAVFVALAKLIDGYNLKENILPVEDARNALISAIMHDTGYIRRINDTKCSDAMYTLTHVKRSVEFAKFYLTEKRWNKREITEVCNIIRCTGLNVNMGDIKFRSKIEKILGCMLGTADYLGQMSDRLYLEKLLFLYREFQEANIVDYTGELDLLKKTIGFYQKVQKMFSEDFEGVYKYARYHFRKRAGINSNLYMVKISRSIKYLSNVLARPEKKYRKKLRRGKIVEKIRRMEIVENRKEDL